MYDKRNYISYNLEYKSPAIHKFHNHSVLEHKILIKYKMEPFNYFSKGNFILGI